MPKVKFDHIVSFSSEDTEYPASNLITGDTKKPWKSKSKGELSINVVLQLEKAIVINNIDIGNEHSAFVEVLVARSTAKENDYQVLLVTSSFMTPLESRQSTNINRVRMFTADQLSKPTSTEKWDRVKVVCTQPFNKQIQYGLSFITLHSPQESVESLSDVTMLGAFKIKPPLSSPYKAGLLFSMRKEFEDSHEKPKTVAEAIKNADLGNAEDRKRLTITPGKLQKNKDCKPSTSAEPKTRNRNELLYDKDDEKPHEKIDKVIERSKMMKQAKMEEKLKADKHSKVPETVKKNLDDVKTKRKVTETKVSGTSNKKVKITKRKSKPFHQLLNGVVLVISGIQNPDRAVLRTLALEMGAKYKPDWDNTCTHLICAFPNTPKFNQVRGKGKIVTRKWIEDCHSQRKRLPWRRYALDKNDIGKSESEEEIDESVRPETEDETAPLQSSSRASRNENVSDVAPSSDYRRSPELNEPVDVRSDSDTDVEITEHKKYDPFAVETDEEILKAEEDAQIVADIPELFEQKMFYIDCDLDKSKMQLERYIEALNGIVIHDGCDVDYVITTVPECCAARKEIESVNKNVVVVRPDWIRDCFNSKQLMPSNNYKVL